MDLNRGNQTPVEEPTHTPAPTLTPTPSPAATPIPTPTPTPTHVPDIMPSETVSSINELFRNAPYNGFPIEDVAKIGIPDAYLGNGIPGDFSLHDFAVMDDEGNLYYIDHSKIKKIDGVKGGKSVVCSMDYSWYDPKADRSYDKLRPYNLYYKDGKLYAAAEWEYGEFEYKHFMLDVFEGEVMYITDSYFDFAYDSRTIKKYYNSDIGRTIYDQFTLRGNTAIGEVATSNGYNYLELKYVSDKYLFFVAYKYERKEDNTWERHTKFIAVDKETMVIADTTFEDEFDFSDKDIIMCINSWMMLFDRSDGTIKLYNIDKGIIITYWDFSGESKYLGYEADEHCVYIKKSLYYTHQPALYNNDPPHYFFENCISSDEIENATELFLKCDIFTFEVTELGYVKTKDYVDKFTCLSSLNEYVVGNYLVVYSDLVEGEDNTPYIYELSFKLGEEIDYDIWKE